VTRSASIGRLRHRVGEAIAAHGLWQPGDRVAVAVSGGLDSVVLLDLLRATRDWHQGVLSVVTVDHGVRNDSADDAAFVAALARGLGLACVQTRLEGVAPTEEALREARYGFLDALEVDVVALGHHRDDQAETVLLQLLRGAGSRGLAAMRWKRDRYVRPLLEIPRAELEAWARHRALDWREDPTNASLQFARNRIRAEVLPLLEAIRPGAAAALARSAGHLAAEDAYLTSLGEPQPPWSLSWLEAEPEALVRRALSARLGSAGRVEAALKIAARGAGVVDLGPLGTLEVEGGALVLRPRPPGSGE